MSANEAMTMYNLIRQTEIRLSEGEEIEGLDIDEMKRTKELAKSVLEDKLKIKVI